MTIDVIKDGVPIQREAVWETLLPSPTISVWSGRPCFDYRARPKVYEGERLLETEDGRFFIVSYEHTD